MSRNERRTRERKVRVTAKMSGSTENVTSSSSTFRWIIAITMPISANTSPTVATTPAVNSSFSTSTSLVTRVINRPIGFLS